MTRREKRIRAACCLPSGLSETEYEIHVAKILQVTAPKAVRIPVFEGGARNLVVGSAGTAVGGKA